jgi:hypothetical protein
VLQWERQALIAEDQNWLPKGDVTGHNPKPWIMMMNAIHLSLLRLWPTTRGQCILTFDIKIMCKFVCFKCRRVRCRCSSTEGLRVFSSRYQKGSSSCAKSWKSEFLQNKLFHAYCRKESSRQQAYRQLRITMQWEILRLCLPAFCRSGTSVSLQYTLLMNAYSVLSSYSKFLISSVVFPRTVFAAAFLMKCLRLR